jgi:hypothetical protein
MNMDRECEDVLKEFGRTLDDLVHCIKGNEFDDDTGLVNKVKENKLELMMVNKRLEKLEKWKDRVVWILVGMGMPAGYGVIELIKTIIAHK